MSDTDGLDALGNALQAPTDGTTEANTTGTPITYVPWFGITRPHQTNLFPAAETPNQADRLDAEKIATGAELAGATGGVNPYTSGSTVKDYFTEGGAYTPDNSTGTYTHTAAPGVMTDDKGNTIGGGMVLKDARQVALDVYNWTPDELNGVAKRMVDLGVIPEQWSRSDVVKEWGTLVQEAADYHLARPTDLMTPLDMLDMNHGDGSATGKATPHVAKIVDKSYTITTNDDARAVLNSVLSSKLGRRATAREVDDFQSALNTAQTANPTTRTTHSTTDASGSYTKSSSAQITGGVDVNNFADSYTDNRNPDSEFGHYQAATTYYNALVNAMRGPVPQR